jgi:glycosyltransferase involved in cell wall biosynthesis
MSQGVPVVTSNRYSLPEVAGDAAIIVQPDSVEEVANALNRIASDPQTRADMIKRGLARVASYSWEMTAKATLQAYTSALA